MAPQRDAPASPRKGSGMIRRTRLNPEPLEGRSLLSGLSVSPTTDQSVSWTPKTGPPVKLLWWSSKGGAMAGKRKVHTSAFKDRVALAAYKDDRTANELAGHYGVHPTLM